MFLASDPIRTEPIISNPGVINFSLVGLHLVHSNVQVTTWWWDESSNGLIDGEGIFIGFEDIVLSLGYSSVNYFVVYKILSFVTIFA